MGLLCWIPNWINEQHSNISCFRPNTYSTRMMKIKQGWTFQKTMILNTAKKTLNWFQKKKIKLLEWPCQSSVVCVLCFRLMFPYLVCFLSLFNVIISLECSAVCVLIILCILVSACSVSCGLVYSLLPGVPVCQPCLVLPCPALSLLKTIIWV